MAATVEVRPLLTATGFLTRKYLFADATPENGDESVALPVWAFYIYHPEKKIQALWDLGIAKVLDRSLESLASVNKKKTRTPARSRRPFERPWQLS
jgi:hypothetical protein